MDDLTFYAAYVPEGDKRRYLSNGEGGLRLLKDRQLLEDYLKVSLPAEQFAQVVIHPVMGTIAVLEPDKAYTIEDAYKSVMKGIEVLSRPGINFDEAQKLLISTLAVEAGAPSEVDLLVERVKRHKHKRGSK